MRYAAQRYGTWEWLDLELPLHTDGPEWALSSFGVMEAEVAPDLGLQRAGDGRLVLEEFGTLIHVESGDSLKSRHWTGIVTSSSLQGKTWRVEIQEFPGYLQGTPVEHLIRGVKADPAELIRQLWQNVQSMRNAWLGVTVHGSTSVRIGTDSDDKVAVARAARDARKQTLDSLSNTKNEKSKELQDATSTLADEVDLARKQVTEAQNAYKNLAASGATEAELASALATVRSRTTTLNNVVAAYKLETSAKEAALRDARTNRDAAQVAYDAAEKAYQDAKDLASEDGGAYEIRPDDTPDAYESLRALSDFSGVEWTTSTTWSETTPDLGVHIHYPSAGTRRDDLVFEIGVNVMEDPNLVRGEDYANASVGVGSGEGTAAIRGNIESSSPRLRRATVFEDKALKTQAQLLASMRRDLTGRTGDPYFEEIEVVDHNFAPMFSWNLGDIITVSGEIPHYGYINKLHRIVAWQMLGEHRAILRLELA